MISLKNERKLTLDIDYFAYKEKFEIERLTLNMLILAEDKIFTYL